MKSSEKLLTIEAVEETPTLIPYLTKLLPQLQQDPTPVVTLLIKLLQPLSFTSSLAYTNSATIADALRSDLAPVNVLALSLLEKATTSSTDAAIVAGMSDVVLELVRRWLTTPHVNVAAEAARILSALLEIDCTHPQDTTRSGEHVRGGGQGLVWRRVFQDKGVYGTILDVCAFRNAGQESSRTARDTTLAQSRLLEILPKLSELDFELLSISQFPYIEAQHGLKRGEGLLDFAAIHMVHTDTDILMHMALIDFYTELLKPGIEPAGRSTNLAKFNSEAGLDFLTSRGIHQHICSYYLDSTSLHDDLDGRLLSGRSAVYLAAYATYFPERLLKATAEDGTAVIAKIVDRISSALSFSGRQALESRKYDLHLLASLPRAALLPRIHAEQMELLPTTFDDSVFSIISADMADPEYLNTLAVLFNGSSDPSTGFETQKWERIGARGLYAYYIAHYPDFYRNLVRIAGIVALTDNALAAINLLTSIITASWDEFPEESSSESVLFNIPTESSMEVLISSSEYPLPPTSGTLAVCQAPAMEHIIPYLCSPAQRFSNLVGGHGDAENAATKVAVAKFEALKRLYENLMKIPAHGSEIEKLRTIVKVRLEEGLWTSGASLGSRIATIQL